MNKVKLTLGVGSPPISAQLQFQGMTAEPGHLKFVDQMQMALLLCKVADLITSVEHQRAQKKMLHRVQRVIYPIPEAQPTPTSNPEVSIIGASATQDAVTA